MRGLGLWRPVRGEVSRLRAPSAAAYPRVLPRRELELGSGVCNREAQREMGLGNVVCDGGALVEKRWSGRMRGLVRGSMAGVSPVELSGVRWNRCCFSTEERVRQPVGKPEVGLIHVLRCEIEYLWKNTPEMDGIDPPAPFKLERNEPTDPGISLTRTFGLEDISIHCIMQVVRKENLPPEEFGIDPKDRMKMMQLTIYIRKGGGFPVLQMKCECYRDGFYIHEVDLLAEDSGESVYAPYFSQRKSKLIYAFQEFLYQRGFDDTLFHYIDRKLEVKRMRKSMITIARILKMLGGLSLSKLSREDREKFLDTLAGDSWG